VKTPARALLVIEKYGGSIMITSRS